MFSPTFPQRRIYALVTSNESLIKSLQSGFHIGRSTTTRLLIEGERSSVLSQFHSRLDSSDAFQPGSWIRVTNGLHKGCLAYILKRKPDECLHVLAMLKPTPSPRILTSHSPNAQRMHTTSALKLEEAQQHYVQFNSEALHRHGIQFLSVIPGNDLELTDPAIEDIEPFIDAGLVVTETINRRLTQEGDRILITKGSFSGIHAVVKTTSSSAIVANFTLLDCPNTISSAIVRYTGYKRVFSAGDEVIVIMGPHKGSHAIVTSSSAHLVVLLLHHCKTQVMCLISRKLSR